MVDYGQRLTHAMQKAAVSIPMLASRLGISYQAVKKARDGKSHFNAVNNAAAAAYLKVRSDWLATGKGDMRPEEPPARSAFGVAEHPAHYHSPQPIAEALVDTVLSIVPARWISIRAQLGEVVRNPERRDSAIQVVGLLLGPLDPTTDISTATSSGDSGLRAAPAPSQQARRKREAAGSA